MAKRIQWENYRVVVTPRRVGDFGYVRVTDSFVESDSAKLHKRYMDICESILSDIRRHVDDVGDVDVVYDKCETCEFCYAEWSADKDGLCESCGR